MKLVYFIFFIYGACGGLLFSQGPSTSGAETPPSFSVPLITPSSLPPGSPMEMRAPSFAHWKVAYTYKDKRDEQIDPATLKDPDVVKMLQADPNFILQLNPPRVRFQDCVKTGNTIHEQEIYARGFTRDRWIVNLAQIEKPLGSEIPIAIMSSLSNEFLDLSKTDFPGLEWVSRSAFKGEISIGDRKYFVFENDSPTGQLPSLTSTSASPLKAAFLEVDEETRLPVMLKLGDATRVYQFETPPGEMLTLPDSYQKALDAANSRTRNLIRGLPPPRGVEAGESNGP